MVDEVFEVLSGMEYPGRFIILGRSPDGENNVAVYGITGRSPSSQARRLIDSNIRIEVEVTDPEILKTGKPELLVYPAIELMGRGLAISNGAHTRTISRYLTNLPIIALSLPEEIILHGQRTWDYEPDEPNFTPRISGCIFGKRYGLGIIRKGVDDSRLEAAWSFDFAPGKGRLIATYTGVNRSPLPSFAGRPIEVSLNAFESAEDAARIVYDEGLKPFAEGRDYRISVASVFRPLVGLDDVVIINRHDSEPRRRRWEA